VRAMDPQHEARREPAACPGGALLSGLQLTLMLTAGALQVALRGGSNRMAPRPAWLHQLWQFP